MNTMKIIEDSIKYEIKFNKNDVLITQGDKNTKMTIPNCIIDMIKKEIVNNTLEEIDEFIAEIDRKKHENN